MTPVFFANQTEFRMIFMRKTILILLLASIYAAACGQIIDRDGGFDPVGITWQGDMSKQRIADLLPLEY